MKYNKPQDTIKLSAKQREKLQTQVNNCLFFRADDLDSASILQDGIVRFASTFSQGYVHRHIPLSESINLQLINMGGLFEKAIDLVLNHSIDASIYAFREAPLNYRDCLVYYANNIDVDMFDEDPTLQLSHYSYNMNTIRTDLASLIGFEFSKLSVSCIEYTALEKVGVPPNFSLLGTFSRRRNEIEIFPLAMLMSAASKRELKVKNPNMSNEEIQKRILMARSDILITLTLETFIHELAHLAFPCTTEQQIKDYILTKEYKKLADEKGVSFTEAKKIVREYVSLGFGEGISNVLLAGEELSDILAHTIRFKLGLLYLLSTPSEIQLVRREFVPSLLEKIKESQVLKFDYSFDEISLDTPFVTERYVDTLPKDFNTLDKGELSTTQYGWESYLQRVVLPQAQDGSMRLVYRSERVSTSAFERTLQKRRSRSNFAKTDYQFVDRIDLADDDLLFAFEGNANILSIPFLEDPLDFLLQLVNKQEFVSSRNAGIGESAGLYMMFDNDEMRIKLVYSPDAETFFEITTGEAWFILSL